MLTRFEFFDGYKSNPSEEVARALGGKTIGGGSANGFILTLDCRRIPGTFDDARNSKPVVVLPVGKHREGP